MLARPNGRKLKSKSLQSFVRIDVATFSLNSRQLFLRLHSWPKVCKFVQHYGESRQVFEEILLIVIFGQGESPSRVTYTPE